MNWKILIKVDSKIYLLRSQYMEDASVKNSWNKIKSSSVSSY